MAVFLGQQRVSLALFSILSAQNIIFVHPTWFYPFSGMKIRVQNHNILAKKLDFFYY